MSFKNKVVLVVGGSSGIGAATAQLFAKQGAKVAIVGRNEAKLYIVANNCKETGAETLIIKADNTKDDEAKTIVDKTIKQFGTLDILINNAGILARGSILEGTIVEKYDFVTRVNLRAAINITSLAAPYLVQTKGNIVNVSSVFSVSLLRTYAYTAYSISKAGLDAFTRGAALELSSSGVRVNSVNPGLTRTDILTNSQIDFTWDNLRDGFKLDKVSEPEEIADLIAYLASDKAKSITGCCHCIDNGMLLKF